MSKSFLIAKDPLIIMLEQADGSYMNSLTEVSYTREQMECLYSKYLKCTCKFGQPCPSCQARAAAMPYLDVREWEKIKKENSNV